MTYYLHLRLRDCIPERYVIRISRTEHINPRTNDETKVIGEFATAVEAYDAARRDRLTHVDHSDRKPDLRRPLLP